jgi:hypothetical protein
MVEQITLAQERNSQRGNHSNMNRHIQQFLFDLIFTVGLIAVVVILAVDPLQIL